MTLSGGGAGGQVDVAYVDVTVRHNGEESMRDLESTVEQGAADAGDKGGNALTRGLKGGLAALPALGLAAGAAVAAAVVAGAGAAIAIAQQANQGVIDIQASLGVTVAEATELGETAKKVFGNNWTGSLAEAQQAVTNVRKEIQGLAKEDIQTVTEGTVAISEKFEEEQSRVAAAVDAVMKSTGLGAQEALDFITSGFQKGLNSSGDFLDTLTEYAPQFEKAKIGGDELFSLLETGAAKGALGTDKIADAFKEFGLTLVDVSDDSSAVYKELGLNQQKIVDGVNSGAISQAQAFQMVTDKLKDVKGVADKTRIGAAIFGGAGEDFANGLTNIDLTKTKLSDLKGSTDQVKNATNTFASVFQTAGRQLQLALEPAGQELLKIANDAMPFVNKAIAALGPIVTQVVGGAVRGIGQAREVFGTLAPYVTQAVAVVRQVLSTIAPYITQVVNAFRPAVQSVGPLFGAAFGLIKTLWETVLRPVLQVIAPIFAGVVTQVGNALSLVVKVVTGVVNAVSALFRGDMAGAVKALEGIFEAGMAFVVRTFRGMGTTILNVIKQVAPQMVGAAGDIIRGLIRGIENGAGQVLDAARNLASGVLDGIKSKLRIQSPSKETYILGEHTVQGFADGIYKTTPVVQSAAAKVAAAAASELAKARAALEADIKTENWVKGLRAVTAAQLEQAQAQARSKGDAEKYNAIGAELARRQDLAAAATQKATDAAKQQREELSNNRAQIAAGEAQERYVDSLRSATSTQLTHTLQVAKTAGEVEKYNLIKTEQQRREDTSTAATDRATSAAKAAAEQLTANRKAITDGLAFGVYVEGLTDYTDAQLAAARANALSAGDSQKFNAVLAEQKTRADAAAQSMSALADAQIAAANSRYRDAQGATDSAFRQTFGAGDVGLIQSLAATTGLSVAAIRADVNAALDDAKRFAPEVATIIERVYAEALIHRREVSAAQVQEAQNVATQEAQAAQDVLTANINVYEELAAYRRELLADQAAQDAAQTARAVAMADERRNQIVEGYQAEEAAAADALITEESLTGQIRELIELGHNPGDTMLDYLKALAEGSGNAAAEAQKVLDKFDAIVFLASKPLALDETGVAARGVRTPANTDTGEGPRPVRQNLTLQPLPPVITPEMLESQKKWNTYLEQQMVEQYKVSISSKVMSDADLEAARVKAVASEDAQRLTLILAEQATRATAAAKVTADSTSLIAAAQGDLNGLLGESIPAYEARARALEDQAELDTVNAQKLRELAAALRDVGKAVDENAAQLNVTLKIGGIDTGIKQLDVYKTAIEGVAGFITQTFEDLTSGADISAGSVVKSFAIMALGVIKQIATMIAAQAALIAVTALIDSATLNPRAFLTLAAAAAVAGIAGGLAARLGADAKAAATTSTGTASRPTSSTGSTSSSNSSVSIPSSQVSVIAAPEWVMQMGAHIDKFGKHIDRLVGEGISVHTDIPPKGGNGGGSAPPASAGWQLGLL